ncbi:MAG: polysaccharide biosynthesis C-terminal domain-containing protein, partial [Sedimenticola sp.]
ILINSVSSLVTRLLSVTVLIWVQQYLLKRISVEEYSLLPVIYSLIIFLPLLTLILTSGVKRYVLEAYANNEDERIAVIVSTMFPLFCLGGGFLFLIGITLAWQIDAVLRIDPEYIDDARIMLILIISLEALRVPVEAFSSGLYVKQRFVLQNVIKIASESVRMALLFTLLLGFSVSVISVVVATVVAGLMEIILLFVVSRRLLPSQRFDQSLFEWSIVKELTNFGGWSSLYGLAGMIRKAADPIILNHLSTPLDVTCFHLGSLVPIRLEVIVNQSFIGSVSPVVVGLHADKQDKKLKTIYLRLGRYAMWGVLLVIAPFLAYYEQIVTLYVGKDYLSAGTVMFLLLACYPVIYGNILYTSLANAKIRMRSLAIREAVSAVVNLMLTLLLVGHFQMGAVGAATATFIVYGLGSILLFWPFGKGMVDATWREVWTDILLPGIMPFATAVVVMLLLASYYSVTSWIALVVNSVLGSIIYFVVLWFMAKEIDKSQFREVLLNLVTRK